MLRVGVIGAGGMGRLHAQNIARYINQAEVVAVADVDRPRAESSAATVGSPSVYDDD